MNSFHNTKVNELLLHHLFLIFIRGIFGVVYSFLLCMIFSVNELYYLPLYITFGEYYLYFTWIYLVLFYMITVVVFRFLLGVRKKYDLYLRGITVYFAAAILSYTALTSI